MEYRRGRASDERRRRVMLDDSRLETSAPEAQPEEDSRPKTRRSRRSYPEDALASRQIRLTDLLPVHSWVILAIVVLVTVAAFGIHLGHQKREALLAKFGASGAIFDVQQPGSLGRGLNVALMGGATAASLLIYSLRRHKMDDYRGHYGIWLWVGLLLSAMTASEYTGATGLVEALIQQNAPVSLLSRMPLILHSAVALGAILFLARLGAEMQKSRMALVVLVLLFGAVGAVVALEAGWRPKGVEVEADLLAFHARVASRGLLFAMLLVYGRYTRLDALGAIQIREKKPRKKAGEKATEKSAEKTSEKNPEKNAEKSNEKSAAAERKELPAAKPTVKATVESPKPQFTPAANSEKQAPVRFTEKPAATIKSPVISTPKPALTLGQKPQSDDEEGDGSDGRLTRSERRRLKQLGKAA